MEPLVILFSSLAVFIVVIVLAIRYARKKHHEKNALFKDLADRLELNYRESKHFFMIIPFIEGVWKGKEILIYEKIVGSGKHQTVLTMVEFPNSPHDFNFKIGKEHFFSKLIKKLGYTDIEFDDFELDKTFLFKAKDEERFRALMDYTLLHETEGIADALAGRIENQDGKLTYVITGTLNKSEQMKKLESILDYLSKIMER